MEYKTISGTTSKHLKVTLLDSRHLEFDKYTLPTLGVNKKKYLWLGIKDNELYLSTTDNAYLGLPFDIEKGYYGKTGSVYAWKHLEDYLDDKYLDNSFDGEDFELERVDGGGDLEKGIYKVKGLKLKGE